MNDIIKIMRAADFAARKHVDQRRKGDGAEPYMNHLVEVASLAAEATDGDADVVIAALLHDTVEDQGVKIEEIVDQFGPKVAGFVAEVTDDKSRPKQERKNLQVANAPHKSDGASVIKLADKTIAASRDDPKIFRVDDAEIIGDGRGKFVEAFWHLLAQKGQDRVREFVDRLVAFVPSDELVHHAP